MSSGDRHGGGIVDPMPLAALCAMAFGAAALGVVWLGGTLGAWAYGVGWDPPAFGVGFVFAAMRGVPPWPGVPQPWIVGGIAAVGSVVLAAVAAGGTWALRRWSSPVPGLATARDVREFTVGARRRQARRLRPSLAETPRREIKPADAGLPLGDLARIGRPLRASFEDVVLVLAGPRSGKTSRIVANLVLEAPGCCLVTSVRYDAYAITKRARERKGAVALFDPQHIAHGTQQVCWDILSMARTLEGARRLASHLANAAENPEKKGGDAFFTQAAKSTLTNLLHAAAIDGRPLEDFLYWTADQRDRSAARILAEHGKGALAESMDKITSLAQETLDGVFEHVRQSVQCLYDPDIAKWVTPQPGAQELDPEQWVGSTNTLYLLSKDGGGGAAGVIAALTDACFRAGVRRAEAAGGRMDPPMLAVLDEAANVCKIEDLPRMYSTMGGFGINIATILQDFDQGIGAWGREGMKELWNKATVKLLGAGLDDQSLLDQISQLVGMRAIVEQSLTSSHSGVSSTRSRRRERVLEISDVRELDRGRALMLATSTRPALLYMPAWYERPEADRLKRDKDHVDHQIRQDASQEAT